MNLELLQRFRDLQVYVGWTPDDAARIKGVAEIIEAGLDSLIEDFYGEALRHPEAARVLTGGQAQIQRLSHSLRNWLCDSMQGRSDSDYVERRWKIGLRHAEIGLNPAFASAAMARLRNGIMTLLAREVSGTNDDFKALAQSFNKMLDLDLSIINDAYEAEHLRRQRLIEQEKSEVKFRKLVEAAAAMVMILRHDETIAYFSPYSESLTGYTAAEVQGKAFVELFVPEAARGSVSKAIAATLVGKPMRAQELPLIHRDGRERWFVWNAQRLDNFDGEAAVLAVGQDFTEQREAQERLLRSERLAGIGQMITGIAHESRNALQRIQSCTEMLELEVETNEEALRLVRRSQVAQDNLLRLFDEVRNYAAPIQLEKAPCRIDAVWHEAWALVETARRDRDVKLEEHTAGVNLVIDIDRFRVVQAFRNLLENSLAACADPVVIQFQCSDAHLQGRAALQISVRDNGPGLTPAARLSVFEPFFTTKTKGTGLGMAIARRIVDSHGGQIVVGQDSSSAGAEFVITLPRSGT
ncbi:MAG: protoglobin domain-containing protein [Pirellulales bacterium]